jgi:hypothetical protein
MSKPTPPDHREPDPRPSGSDYSIRARRLNRLSEAAQKPLTMFSGVGAVLGVAGCVALGLTPIGLGVTLGLAFVSGTSWLYQYYLNGDVLEQSYLDKLRQQTITWEQQEQDYLLAECQRKKFTAAADCWQRLCATTDKANDFIDRMIKPTRAVRARELQEYVSAVFYRCSLLIQRALEIRSGLEFTKIEVVRRELQELRERLAANNSPEQQKKLQEKIANRELMIADYDKKILEAKLLLDEVDEIEIRLERSIVDLNSSSNAEQPESLLEASNSAIVNFEEQLTATIEVDRHFRQLEQQ